MLKLLVTGGRAYGDRDVIWNVLTKLHKRYGLSMVIHGDAKGCDTIAGAWARAAGVQEVKCPANWKVLGDSAGPRRNCLMLELQPDAVAAFPGGRGTEHMKAIARKAGVKVLEINPENHQ